MALLTDGPVTTIAGLQAYDSSILDTARTEGIDLDAKIAVAQREIEIEVSVFLLRSGDGTAVTANGDADLHKVAVSAGIERWHTLATLAAVYCDAHGSQINERYLARWQHYARLAREAADMAFEAGIGIVRNPISRPTVPAVTPGGAAGQGLYSIETAWRSAFGGSSSASPRVSYDLASGAQPVVSPGSAPADAAGWDVFVAADGGVALRQNASMLAPGASWTMPAGELTAGPPAGPGQTPDYFVRRSRTLRRG